MKSKVYIRATERADGSVLLPDMYGSAYLASKGHQLRGVERMEGSRFGFVFEQDATLDADYLDFLNDAPVGAQQFVGAMYRLKRLIREAENKSR